MAQGRAKEKVMPKKPLVVVIGKTTFTTFQDNADESDCALKDDCVLAQSRAWRWHSKSRGRITATSGESFHSRGNAERALKAFLRTFGHG